MCVPVSFYTQLLRGSEHANLRGIARKVYIHIINTSEILRRTVNACLRKCFVAYVHMHSFRAKQDKSI